MGRSFLSIKLAAAFGLLVAGAVTAQQQLTPADAPEVRAERLHAAKDCGERVSELARTPRATAPSAQAARAARS